MSEHRPSRSRDPVDENGELAAGVAAGQRTAFERLHARLDAGLRRMFIRRSGGRGDLADELGQQTWGRLWQAGLEKRYDPTRSAVSTYVYAIANNVWLQHYRAARRSATAELSDDMRREDAGDDALAHAELLEAVRDCLHGPGPSAMSPDERFIVVELARGGTERELASTLRIAASTVHARKLSGHEKLRNCLHRKGFSQEIVEQIRLLLE